MFIGWIPRRGVDAHSPLTELPDTGTTHRPVALSPCCSRRSAARWCFLLIRKAEILQQVPGPAFGCFTPGFPICSSCSFFHIQVAWGGVGSELRKKATLNCSHNTFRQPLRKTGGFLSFSQPTLFALFRSSVLGTSDPKLAYCAGCRFIGARRKKGRRQEKKGPNALDGSVARCLFHHPDNDE